MVAFGAIKLIVFIAVFDLAFCNKCYDDFRTRKYIPKHADGLKDTKLKIQYNNHDVQCDGRVSLLDVVYAPTLTLDLTDKCTNVTVLCFSPDDILNPPIPSWVVFNVPSSALKRGFNNGGEITDELAGHKKEGDVIAPYLIPSDPTSQVRELTLIFFIYCQCQYVCEEHELDRIDRLHNFNVKSYMKKHGLNCPVSGKFLHVSTTGLSPLPLKVSPLQVPLPALPSLGNTANLKVPA